MSTTYKTPGVYVEEISKFPPSVAQVETAIPAFIGYTAKAIKKGESLTNDPTRISSLLEYETYFGAAKEETTIAVIINDTVVNGTLQRDVNVAQPTTPSPYLMYYSMQIYFANGGGPCYIVSVNDYDTGGANNVAFSDLSDGLDLLEKEDEPTLIVFPDAKALGEVEFYSLYQSALLQCNDMQDRFAIIDTHTSDDTEDAAQVVRDRISLGKDYLKYGAVYFPYLETILDYQYDEATVAITHSSEDSQALADEIEAANTALTEVNQNQSDNVILVSDLTNADTALQLLTNTNAALPVNKATISDAIQLIIDELDEVVVSGGNAVTAGHDAATAASEDAPTAAAATLAANNLDTALTNVASDLPIMLSALAAHIVVIDGAPNNAGGGATVKTESTLALATVTTLNAVVQAIIDLINPPLIEAIAAAQAVDTNGILDGLMLNAVEAVDNSAYNVIKTEINAMPITLPPSSTMAGVYARVDSDRGVWKAPANVGVNYVIKPKLKVTHEQQRDLNVHITGKSINAIRSFTGKGILVWGARTLAGNDNEWKYVPVRRFFNMVEESVERATEQFVFEPNDANTWVKIRAMIENFLTLQWRAGALAGAKPEQAFYVRVGLGETMTADDILNGVMNVEIGMAAVRPAEFIVLKFSHKMQEA